MDPKLHQEMLKAISDKLTGVMQMYLDTCSRCGICASACHVYASVPEFENTPVYRAESIRKIYKKYFKLQGKLLPMIGEAVDIDDNTADMLKKTAYSCTGCRRCMVYCPFGIDTQQIMSIAKLLLIKAESEPEILSMLADVSISKGDSLDSVKENFLKGLKKIEADVVEKWKLEAGKVAIPTEVENADILYVALAGAHSIVPAAAIFNAAGENWTLSFFEAVNFGAFVGDPSKTKLILDRIINEAIRLKVKEVCICECGTAYRVMAQLSGDKPFKVSSITQVHARYIREGRIKLKPLPADVSVTYHDPCQIARNGGVIDEPRYIIGQIAKDYREMSPDPKTNWCCGGGGGLVALGDETIDFRMKSSKVKADQVKKSRAKILITACENCHTQLDNLNEHYKLGVEVKFLSSMVADALIK
ncbi:MAG: (Fe-S)-binding protein [Deltaproteobacteria bacterium]|uniref:(Fe-S)-binding protein n=1 Tax=Desulfobacula sp. TaxID=2593537 RepID=UPI0019B9DC79|nr:(Fe-S)-binding protein [Candidatus Desulfobacula maris]MBL6994385.1 (Fe-S)-binding protein [Desulfobacula sp.]